MGSTELPLRLTFNAGDYEDALASLARAPFVSGEEPFVEEFTATGVARASDLVPIDSVVRQVTDPYVERILARGQGWSALVDRYRNGNVEVSVSATCPEALAKAVADIRARCPVVEKAPDSLAVEFWYAAAAGHRNVERRIDAPVWGDISAHYAGAVRAKVARLADMARRAAVGGSCSGTVPRERARRRRSGPWPGHGRRGAERCS